MYPNRLQAHYASLDNPQAAIRNLRATLIQKNVIKSSFRASLSTGGLSSSRLQSSPVAASIQLYNPRCDKAEEQH